MPTTAFSSADVISITEGYNVNSVTGFGVPALTNINFGAFFLTGNVSSLVAGNPVSVQIEYAKNGTITFASIPVDAKISRVVYSTDRRVNVTVSSSGGVLSTQTISDVQPRSLVDLIYTPPAGTHVPNPTFPYILSAINSGLGYNDSSEVIDTIFDYSASPIGRTNLFALFGSIALKATVKATSTGAGSNSVVFTGNGVGYNSFSITVTYTVPGYSWFIPYHTKIVNGRPFRIPTGPAVYIPIAGSNPNTYYNAGDVEPVATYWQSPEWWFFFPYTILIPDDVSDWVPVTAPTCVSCLSLPLETITVLVADASGAYRLQLDKTNDTMYVRIDPLNVTTEDSMIPPPTVKLGYIP